MPRSSSTTTTAAPRKPRRKPTTAAPAPATTLPAPLATKRRAPTSRAAGPPALPPPVEHRVHITPQHVYDVVAVVLVALAVLLLASFLPGRPVGSVGEWLNTFG